VTAIKERIEVAKWVLERNLAWIAAAEVKVAAIVAITTAMLGGLGVAFSGTTGATRTDWANLWSYVAAGGLLTSLALSAAALMPRTSGPPRSMVFFGRIAAVRREEFVEQFTKATESELLTDWVEQIHANAVVANKKFTYIKRSMGWAFASLIPWVGAIVTLLHGK
jgi:hypothetical protein